MPCGACHSALLLAGRLEQPGGGLRQVHEGRSPSRLKPRNSGNGTAALPSVLQEFMPNSRFSSADGINDTDSNLVRHEEQEPA